MATLKLQCIPAGDDECASHHIGAPGGYECWQFYAQDVAGRLAVFFAIHDGLASAAEYQRRYAAYRRRPTRNEPPTPGEFPAVQILVVENGKRIAGGTAWMAAGSLKATVNRLELGENRVEFAGDAINIRFSGGDSSGEMTFRSILGGGGNAIEVARSEGEEEARHFWMPARPLCEVVGKIGVENRTIELRGIGAHNHVFGLEPIGLRAREVLRGWILFPKMSVIFYVADRVGMLAVGDRAGMRFIDVPSIAVNWRRRFFGGARLREIEFLGHDILLREARVVEATGFEGFFLCDAFVGGEQGVGWVEVQRSSLV
jgi:hypothetical protein